MAEEQEDAQRLALARAVRDACLQAVRDAWEDGGLSGLCAEGRFELAVGALQGLDLGAVLARARAEAARGERPAP